MTDPLRFSLVNHFLMKVSIEDIYSVSTRELVFYGQLRALMRFALDRLEQAPSLRSAAPKLSSWLKSMFTHSLFEFVCFKSGGGKTDLRLRGLALRELRQAYL